MTHGLVRHTHSCRQITVTIVELECAAEESIGFLDEVYDRTHDGFYLYLANHYRHALGRAPRAEAPAARTMLVTDAGRFGKAPAR